MKNRIASELPQLLILALPFLLLPLLWGNLPERIPAHFGIDGEVNRYDPKWVVMILYPLFNVGLALLLYVVPFIDPKVRKDPAGSESIIRILKVIRLTSTAFVLALHFGLIANALGMEFSITRYSLVGTGLVFVVIGNLINTIRPNYFAGVRTPWTLEDPEIWRKTHRVMSRVMVALGLAFIPMGIFAPESVAIGGVVVSSIGFSILAVGYSYWLYVKKNRRDASDQSASSSA